VSGKLLAVSLMVNPEPRPALMDSELDALRPIGFVSVRRAAKIGLDF
jgi:hypothetical protein